ncbi:Abortive infection protein [Collimonas arenae]|uniref:Abortive infection protein n=1 Tax=Collimonas arenae TaxID=279058 RepID=A0A0A1FKF6_9BURK|nr:type II CAAX endopeptidase family protein [Collimonas arenae]AIY43367.1 Abortive infection protein [Collimonas arenae]
MTDISGFHAILLLAQLRLTRLLNVTTNGFSRVFKRSGQRNATPGKKRNRWLITMLVAIAMLFSAGNMAKQSIFNLHCELSDGVLCYPGDGSELNGRKMDRVTHELLAKPFSAGLASGLTMELTLLFFASFLMPLGARELSQQDWDLEWLVTLPISRKNLLWGRLLERSVVNPVGWLLLWSTCLLIAWYSGYRWSAPIIAVFAAFSLLLPAASIRTLIDTGLRLSLPPSQMRNLQGIISLVNLPVLYLAIAFGMKTEISFIFDWARAFPSWTAWTPPGLVIQAINAHDMTHALMASMALIIEVITIVCASILILQYQLRNGIVAAGGRESVKRSALAGVARKTRWNLAIGSVVQRRELRLLSRDRNFLVQSLILPVVIVLSQLVLNGRFSSVSQISGSPTMMASMAFAISAYVLMLSAFQTLNAEGGALWMLYTFPHSIQNVLKEKAQLWAVVALLYPFAIFAIGIYFSRAINWELLGLLCLVLLGIPIYSLIAVSLGVFACDPMAQDAQTKVRPTYVYLYVLLSGLYGYTLFADAWWQKLVLVILTGSLSLALWQKARDEIPYLLDPAESPAARVSTADGLIAAMLFFVLQSVSVLIMSDGSRNISDSAVVIGFIIAGTLTYCLTRYTFWRTKAQGVPAVTGSNLGTSVGWGLCGGALSAILGLVYIYVIRHLDLWQGSNPVVELSSRVWLIGLAVVAAPLFEEFIFRGLIFGGLRRSMPSFTAILMSAAIFAIVHPPQSMLPVFVLGVCTAFAYDRTKTLLAPMLVHAIYNAVVIGFQLTM